MLPRVMIMRSKPISVVLLLPLEPMAASVNELDAGSLTPRNTSSPLML